MKTKAFTLVEILMVITIILIITSMLLPGLDTVRTKAVIARWVEYMAQQRAATEVVAIYDFQNEDGLTLTSKGGLTSDLKTIPGLNNGTIQGNTIWTHGRWGPGMGKNALEFFGSPDRVLCGAQMGVDNGNNPKITNGVRLRGKSLTVLFWCKRKAFGGDQFIVSGGRGGANKQLHVGFRGDRVHFGFWSNDCSSSVTITDSEWHQYACVYDSGENLRTIYIDGEVDSTNTPSGYTQFDGSNGNYFHIGSMFDSGYFVGVIDELQVLGRAMSAEEIKANYSMGGGE